MNWSSEDDARRRRDEDDRKRRREDDDKRRQQERDVKKRREEDRRKKKRRKIREKKSKDRKAKMAKKKREAQLLTGASVDDLLTGKAQEELFGESTFDPDEYALKDAKVNRAAVYRSTWGQNATEIYDKLEKIEEKDTNDSGQQMSKALTGSSQVTKFRPFQKTSKPIDPSQIKPVTGPPSAEERIAEATKFGVRRLKRGGF